MTTGTGPTIGTATARDDWEQRISHRSDERETAAVPDLPPPGGLKATPGRGHVTLRWEPVPGAVGYLVHRAPAGADRARPRRPSTTSAATSWPCPRPGTSTPPASPARRTTTRWRRSRP